MTRLASFVNRCCSPGQRSDGSRAIPMSDLREPRSGLRQIELVRRGHTRARRYLRSQAAQTLLQRRQELQHHARPAVVTHEADTPCLALELAEAAADLDAELVEQS